MDVDEYYSLNRAMKLGPERANSAAVVREYNRELSDIALACGSRGADFLCECTSSSCLDTLPISVLDYERVRAGSGEPFIVVTGHEGTTLERVLDVQDGYLVVAR